MLQKIIVSSYLNFVLIIIIFFAGQIIMFVGHVLSWVFVGCYTINKCMFGGFPGAIQNIGLMFLHILIDG